MKIGWLNKFDDAIIEAGSQVTTLPVQNLTVPHLSTKWQSKSGANSTYILCALDSQTAIRCVAVLGTNLTSAATVRIRGSNTDITAVTGEVIDTGTLSNVIDTNYGALYHSFSQDFTAQYWRIDLTDTSLSFIRAGRVFLGPAWTPTKGMLFGWNITFMDATSRGRSRGGQTYIDQRFRMRVLNFTLSFMNQAEMFNNAFEIDRVNGTTQDVLVIPDEDGAFISQMSMYGLIVNAFPLTNDTYQIYRHRYQIEERR